MRRKWMTLLTLAALVATLVFTYSTSFAAYTVSVNADGANQGDDAYEIFQDAFGSNPVDGPSSGHIWESYSEQVGHVFQFYVPADGAYDGSDRQRNEVKVYGSSPSNLKAGYGSIFTYNWKFRPTDYQMPSAGFNHIFQLKAYGGDAGAPILTFSLADGELRFRHSPIGATMDQVEVLASTDWDNVDGQWVEATVTVENSDSGDISMTLKRLNGTTLMSYSGTKDNWRSGAEFNRPKWGIYRKVFSGMEDGTIQFANFNITNNEGVWPGGKNSGGSGGGDFDGYYRIMARHSGKAVVVESASTSNGANIFQYSYGGSSTNDEWELVSIGDGYYRIINRNSDKDMVVQNASTSSGANVFQYSYGGSATNDEWAIEDAGDGYYRIVNRNSGKVLDVQGNGTSNGDNIQQSTWNGGTNQQFEIISVN